MPKQFVAVKFRTSDSRTFTYVNNGEPVADGDVVRVPDRSGGGWKKVYVVTVTHIDPQLPYDLKPILGRHVEEPETVNDLLVETGSRDPLDAPLSF